MTAIGLAAVQAVWLLGPLAGAPGDYLVGSHIHPDNLANHWLLYWAADTVWSGGSLAHTTAYYWPVGDAPLLSGDGTQALLYTPLHALLPWPAGVTLLTGLTLFLNGVCGWWTAWAITRDARTSWVAIVVCGWSPYVLMELSAGRFAQSAVWPLLLYLGLWWRHLAAPGPGRAVGAAVSLFYATASYWYYGWFGVLAGALAFAVMRRDHPAEARRSHWRWHALFSCCFLVLLAPLAWVFIAHWDSVPGTSETMAFPPASAAHDRLPFLPPLVPGDPTATAAVQSGVMWGLALLGAVAGWGQRRLRAVVVVGGAFWMLGWGDAFPGAPFNTVYGLHAALRRFWWPVRHVAVVQCMVGVLAAVGLAELVRRLPGRSWAWGLGGAALVAGALGLQGVPTEVQRTGLSFPTEADARLAELPEGAVVVFPIAPEATGTNDAMLHQLAHRHPIVMGHSPWVERARPPAWNAWIASQPFLSRLAELERTGAHGTVFPVREAEIRALKAEGVRWFVLDRSLVPLALKDMVRAHDQLLDAAFGRPVIRTRDVQVWDIEGFRESRDVEVMDWAWPVDLQPAGPEWPLAAKRPRSEMLADPGNPGPTPARQP